MTEEEQNRISVMIQAVQKAVLDSVGPMMTEIKADVKAVKDQMNAQSTDIAILKDRDASRNNNKQDVWKLITTVIAFGAVIVSIWAKK